MRKNRWHIIPQALVLVVLINGLAGASQLVQFALGLHDGAITTDGGNNDDNILVDNYVGGGLTQATLFPSISDGGWHVSGTAVGDADNDGTKELVVAYNYKGINGGAVGVYHYAGGALVQERWIQVSDSGWTVTGVGVGNANNSLDGSNEIVLGYHYGSRRNAENDMVIVYSYDGTNLNEIDRTDVWEGGWNINGVGVGNADNADNDNEIVVSWSYCTFGDPCAPAADVLQVLDFTNNSWASVAWGLQLDAGSRWDTTGLDVGDVDNDGLNEIAISWRQFLADGGETGQRITVHNYAAGVVTLKSTVLDAPSSYWGIQGLGLGFLVPPANCTDAKNAGYRQPGDVNGDCHVNFKDFALMASEWLKCVEPGVAGCLSPWNN